jgi:hypothetical protein
MTGCRIQRHHLESALPTLLWTLNHSVRHPEGAAVPRQAQTARSGGLFSGFEDEFTTTYENARERDSVAARSRGIKDD